MNWPTKTYLKFAAAVIIISVLSFLPLYYVRAAGAIMYITKEFVLDVAARLFARNVLSHIENGIVGKILKAGREGGPAFIQDWRIFTQKAQYRGEDIFRAILAEAIYGSNAPVCPYMRSSLADIFNAHKIMGFDANQYRVDSLVSFLLKNKCSLPPNFDIDAFRRDFNNGGWEAWEKLIQPQNNFFGVFNNSLDEVLKQRFFEEKIDTGEAIAGEGSLGKRDKCRGEGQNRECTIMGIVITPGTIFSDSQKAVINRELDWLVSADELSEVIAAASYTLLDRLEDFAAGKLSPVNENILKQGESSYDYSEDLRRAEEEQQMFENYIVSPTPTPEETPAPEETPTPEVTT
jgi:hypothetical protein